MQRAPSTCRDCPRSGFTLIELITVIAIIAILSTILIATVGGANTSAKKAKTRAQFSQWGSAIELFRQEYGFYPDFEEAVDGFDWVISDATDSAAFVETLSGRQLNGDRLESDSSGYESGNTKSIQFLSIGPDDLNNNDELQDAFGNTSIAVLFDRDYNGMITIGEPPSDYTSRPDVTGPGGSFNPFDDLNLDTTVRTGVLFYSPGAGQSAGDIVRSW